MPYILIPGKNWALNIVTLLVWQDSFDLLTLLWSGTTETLLLVMFALEIFVDIAFKSTTVCFKKLCLTHSIFN